MGEGAVPRAYLGRTSGATRVALVHDWLNQYGGAERVLEHLVDTFPGAPIYTSMYWREGMPAQYREWDIHTTWMDRLPGVYRWHQIYLPFYALAFDRLSLGREGYDVIISNKSGFCHGTRTGDIPHLCYCLAPTRYVWQFDRYAAREQIPGAVRVLLKPIVSSLRRWDYGAAQRETLRFVAISHEIQQRIQTFYGRSSTVIYPPVDIRRYADASASRDAGLPEGYYLVVSRLVPYKRIDLAVRAFTTLGLPLVVVGGGRDRQVLESIAGPTVRFLGHVPDAQLPGLFAGCKAFVFPGLEDFGIAPVEAQAAGRPVIAYRGGGALDTVVEGMTGAFFSEATATSLEEAVRAFDANAVDPDVIRENAARFSPERFRSALAAEIRAIRG